MNNIYEIGKDLEKFHDVIHQLRFDSSNPELDKLITNANTTNPISAGERFLVKMEIRRLAKPCTRLLDFRDLFKNACEEFDHNGQHHFIDKASKTLLLREIERYGNAYTMGAYYHVSHTAKLSSRSKIDHEQLISIPTAHLLSLTDFPRRNESRAYYASKIAVFKTKPTGQMQPQEKLQGISAITTDLSQSGVCIKVKTDELALDENIIFLWFSGLEQEYVFTHDLMIQFYVMGTEQKGDFSYLRLKMHESQQQPAYDGYANILKQLIRANQRRNKVPLEHVVTSIISKGHEQYAISRMNNLPVALGLVNERWVALCLFQNDAAMPYYNYFTAQPDRALISDIFASNYAQAMLNSNKAFVEYFFLIRLESKSTKSHFALVPTHTLEHDVLARQMVAFACAHDQLKLFRLDGVNIDPLKDSYVPSSLPDSAGEVFENMNREVAQNALKVLSPAQRLCFITDVSDSLTSFDLTEQWKSSVNFSLTDFNINNGYRKYMLPAAAKAPLAMKVTRAENNDFRGEDRFDYKMKLCLHPKGEPKNTVNATTLDISTKGLRVLLDNPIALKIGAVVMIDFVSLNASAKLNLLRQPYKITGKDKALQLRLVISGPASDHTARQALRKVIYKNIGRLKVSGLGDEIYGLSRAMRNIVATNHVTCPVFLSRLNKQCVASAIAVNPKLELPAMSQQDNTFCYDTFAIMLEQNFFRQRATLAIQNSNSEQPFDVWYLIAVQRKGKDTNKSTWLLRDAQMLNAKGQLNQYLKQVPHLGQVLIYRVETTKKGRIFNKYMRDEIHYLTQFSVGQSKEVLDQINHVLGLCYITDETKLLLPLLTLAK